MRILLARALAVEAEFLLADEPIAALDPLHQLQVMEMLRETARQGRGVIVVLHDLALASRFCDRLVLLADGGVLVQGSPREVLTDANVQARLRCRCRSRRTRWRAVPAAVGPLVEGWPPRARPGRPGVTEPPVLCQ